jgi:hypothetical protein
VRGLKRALKNGSRYFERRMSFGISADFFIYNNYNNHIINNKSDKSKILNLQMIARHCQWRGVSASLSVVFLLKCVIENGAFVSYKL